jgi:hypothetical protein
MNNRNRKARRAAAAQARRNAATIEPTHLTARGIVDHALDGANDINVVVGPLCWQPSDGLAAKRWYFCIATGDPVQGFRHDAVTVRSDSPEMDRQSVIAELINRRPIVIHDTDDEIGLARLCEALWPCERATQLRMAVERELAAR